METRIANQFVIDVINEGGCVCTEIGDQYNTLEEAIKAAKKITRKQAEKAGAYNRKDGTGVQIQITACDDESSIAADGVIGGMVIWEKWL